jgi:hypothetical protein
MPRCVARVGFGDKEIGNANLQNSRGITLSVSEREVAVEKYRRVVGTS